MNLQRSSRNGRTKDLQSTKMSTEDYIQDMKIEPDELDLEWLNQPQLMVKYSAKLSEAKERRDLMKEEVDLMRAECDRDIREAPGTSLRFR